MAISKSSKIIFIIIAALALCGVGMAAGAYSLLKSNAVAQNAEIYLPEGADYRVLQDSLTKAGAILNMDRLELVSGLLSAQEQVRSGHYTLRPGMSYLEVTRMFQRGLQSPILVRFNNIRTMPQLAGRLARQLRADSLEFASVLLDDTTARHYGFTRETFIAMFIPNTYEMYWTITPEAFADRMKREYDRFWTPQREKKLEETGLTRIEAVTLASIVFEETKKEDEMPTVAGVYINRLNRGMRLEADPTVKFAIGDFTLRRILFRHLEVESPYNTYRNTGLPPGPICMPPVVAVDAVLNYQKHKYIFFCARPDFSGYHNFAENLAGHNRNRQAWIEAINRAGIR